MCINIYFCTININRHEIFYKDESKDRESDAGSLLVPQFTVAQDISRSTAIARTEGVCNPLLW